MTREEAASYLPWLPDIKHSMCRRAPWHDYREPGLYMITIVVKGRKPLLGTLQTIPAPRIAWSPLGRAIFYDERPKISRVYPMVELWLMCIMPDHIHMILSVNASLPEGKHLGHVVGAFKGGCSRSWWSMTGVPADADPQNKPPLFEDNYHDRLLLSPNQLDIWKKYLTDNPRRLAIKRQHPEFFTTLHQFAVGDRLCQIYGNRFLLDIPDKMAVVVHGRDTDQDYKVKCDQWLACGERGGVLVSASIAQREKAVMRIAMERGYSVILLRENGFPTVYKPSGEAFDACASGQLLQISPWDFHHGTRKIARAQCLELNALAESIAQALNPRPQA